MPESDDSDPALLTKAQRGWFRGEKDYRPSVERDMRERVHSRLATSILVDFPLVYSEADLESVVERIPRNELRQTLATAVALVYKLADIGGLDPETVLNDGVQQAKTSRGEAILQRLQDEPESVTLGELHLLSEAGLIDEEMYADYFRAAFGFSEETVSSDEAGEIRYRWDEESEQKARINVGQLEGRQAMLDEIGLTSDEDED